MNNLRKKVFQAFKSLHNARKIVFNGDSRALREVRDKINEEFKKNKNVTDTKAIENLIIYANDVAKELRTTVVQAVETKPGVYGLKLTPESQMEDNFPFNPNVEITSQKWKKKMNQPCKDCNDK